MKTMRVQLAGLAILMMPLGAGTVWGQAAAPGHHAGHFTPAGTFTQQGQGNHGLVRGVARGYFGEVFPVLMQNNGAYGLTLPSVGGLPNFGTPGYGAAMAPGGFAQPPVVMPPAAVPETPPQKQPEEKKESKEQSGPDLTSLTSAFVAPPAGSSSKGTAGSTKGSEVEASRQFWAGYRSYWAKDWKQALRQFEAATTQYPADARYWYFRSLAENELGQDAAAERSLRRAVQLHRQGLPSADVIGLALERVQGPSRQNLRAALEGGR